MILKRIESCYIEWFYAALLFLMSGPYFCWNTGMSSIAGFSLMLLFIVLPSFVKGKLLLSSKDMLPLLLLVMFYLLAAIRHEGTVAGSIYYAIFPILFFCNSWTLVGGYEKFIKILSIFLVPSIIVYLLVTFFNVKFSYSLINPLNELKGFQYRQYPFLVMDTVERGLLITRFHGLYDEPGVIGSIAVLILVIKDYNFKNCYLIPIFIAGLLSFSFYFYCVSIIYLLFNLKSVAVKVSICVIIVLLIFLYQIDDLHTLLFNRFIIEDGKLAGNSRELSGMTTWYNGFRFSWHYFVGLGSGANLIFNEGGASYKDIIINYGLIMFLMFIFGYIVWAYNHKCSTKHFILMSFLISSFIFQRPFITDMFLALSFMYAIHYRNVNCLQMLAVKAVKLRNI